MTGLLRTHASGDETVAAARTLLRAGKERHWAGWLQRHYSAETSAAAAWTFVAILEAIVSGRPPLARLDDPLAQDELEQRLAAIRARARRLEPRDT